MPRLLLSSLGALAITLDGKAITAAFDTNQTRALLIYLAVEATRPHPREYLAGLLWPDQPDQRALHNLRQRLATLRKILGDDSAEVPFLIITRDSVQWNSASDYWLDVREFEITLRAAYRHFQLRNGQGWLNIRLLRQALQVYQGHFLDLFYLSGSDLFLEWVSLNREDYDRRAVEALALLSDYYERRGEYAQARQAVARIIKLAPWEETAQAQMMRLLAMDQQWSSAQNQFALLRRFLHENLGVEPSQSTLSLFNQIRSAAAENIAFPPRLLRSQHNLPVSPTPFIGRAAELNLLSERLADPECRLLTLSGPGGIGKTRLALEAAWEQVGNLADGVFFVVLVSVRTGRLILPAIADALGIVFSDRIDPETQLLDYLRNKRLLLILDNFEHLLAVQEDGTRFLSEILQQAPGVKLLVTSRQRLNLQEECVYLLDGMNYPAVGGGSAVEALDSFDALTLFARRAHQVRSDFVLDESTIPAVVGICQFFDGLPLGVELAAASCWTSTCHEILDQVARKLEPLTASASNVPPRHRSVSTAIDISWQLLNKEQQGVFCQLAVFRGGFEGDAALAVAGGGLTAGQMVLMLSALVDRSLLRRSAGGRYDLHEVIRQYAAEKLAKCSGFAGEAAGRHASYFAGFIASQNSNLKGQGQILALELIHRELENTRTAWLWLAENRYVDEISRCADCIYQYFNIRSLFSEGIDLFRQATQSFEGYEPGLFALGVCLSRLGALAYRSRENTLAKETLRRSHEIFTCLDEREELAFCLISTSGLQLRQKEYELALDYAYQSLALYRGAADESGEAYALYLLGLIKDRMGRFEEAWPLLTESLKIGRRLGGQKRLIAPLNLLGDLACNKGNYESAEKYFQEGMEISRVLKDRYNQAILLNNLASVFQARECYDQEKAVFEASLALCREIGDRDGEATSLNGLGEMAVHLGEYRQAVDYSHQALQIAHQVDEVWTIIHCHNNLGEAYCGLGDKSAAEFHTRQALQAASEIQSLDLLARVAVTLGRVYQLKGDTERAVQLLQAALAHSSIEDEPRVKARRWLAEMGASGEVKSRDDVLVKNVNFENISRE
jgi:predicted ATPase/DNA-binding SARP family transcriptional activator